MASFPGEKLTDKIGMTELNDIFLNSMPNSLIKQVYMKGFDCKYISKKTLNMFEYMEITEYIYDGLVELKKKLLGNMTTMLVTAR